MKTLILTLTLIFTSYAHAETGLWERFCLDNKIADACGKAINSLTEKLEAADGDQAVDLATRIQKVSEFGCKLNHKASCERVEGMTIESAQYVPSMLEEESEN